MADLPQEFLTRMQEQLGGEFPAFLASFQQPATRGLRVNTLKCGTAAFAERSPFALEPVQWCAEGFYYAEPDRPGKHPYHEAGVYYLQEPSAMAVAALAAVKPGERVLDLCAAPGGKSTALAAALKGSGLLVANEVHPTRAKILSQNIERMGVVNAVVTNEPVDKLAARMAGAFDCVVVDAPCSGEGMFRKDEVAIREWRMEHVAMCAARQREILRSAVEMVRPGGRLVYSTCTFNREENEENVAWLTTEFGLEAVEVRRLWPHKERGEGHFAALLRAPGNASCAALDGAGMTAQEAAVDGWRSFSEEALTIAPQGIEVSFGDHVYLLPTVFPLAGLRVLRAGLHAGEWKKNRFEPSHALALGRTGADARRVCPLDWELAVRFLKGETISCDGEKGWTLVTVDGFSLGWGKWSAGVLKNHYPKGLRWV